MDWATGILFVLHIGGAIVAFGPTFAFPVIAAMGGGEPMHANFATRISGRIEERMVVPLALFQAVTGVGLIWALQYDVFAHAWLLGAIVLYVIAMAIALGNQVPVTRRLVAATSAPPPAPAEGAAPAGPPPHVAALIRRVQLGGIAASILLVAIIILMVLGTQGLLG
jgi:hypothetical protein